MRTDNTIPDPDDDLPHDTFADEAADELDPTVSDLRGTCSARADDGADLFLVLPHLRREPQLAADRGDIELKFGDDWAAKITSAVTARFVAEDGASYRSSMAAIGDRRSSHIPSPSMSTLSPT